MILLSFDQSTRATGWCIFRDGIYIEHGLIDLKKDKDESAERCLKMQLGIKEVIDYAKPDFVVIEDTVLQRQPQTLKDLSQLQGVIIGICRGTGIPCTTIFPSVWRKQLGFKQGKGIKRADLKKQALEYVVLKYNLCPTEDECEAICIGSAYLKQSKV